MNNAEKFIELLENGKFKKEGITENERGGLIKDYTINQEQNDLNELNTIAYDEIKKVKVKGYVGDN